MSQHFHPCECGMPIRCYCDGDPKVQCYECSSGRESVYTWGFLPRDCCLLNARPARPDELKTYRLAAGGADWFLCPECKRAFGREPKEMGLYVDQRS